MIVNGKDNIEEVLQLGHMMHDESPVFRAASWDDDKLREIANLPHAYVSLMEMEGQSVGFVFGYLEEQFFGHDLQATMVCLYLLPDYRGRGTLAAQLVADFEAWARAQGAKYASLGQSTGPKDINRYKLFAEAMGYKVTGFNTHKEL